MVKSVNDFPFSIAQKTSEEDSIVWLKETNKYIILNSAMKKVWPLSYQIYKYFVDHLAIKIP